MKDKQYIISESDLKKLYLIGYDDRGYDNLAPTPAVDKFLSDKTPIEPNPDMVKVIVDELRNEYGEGEECDSCKEHGECGDWCFYLVATTLLTKLNIPDRLDDTFLSGKMYGKEAMDAIFNTQGGEDAE